jgi:hypothetical protein
VAKNKTKTILILVIIFEVRSSLRLPVTFCRFAMGGIFTTELYAEHKTVCGTRNPCFCKYAVEQKLR